MQTLTRLLFLLSCALLLGGCARRSLPATTPSATQAAARVEATGSPSATATTAPTSTATATPRPSGTPAPTETALPTTTPTATPLYCPDETPPAAAAYPLRVYFVERGNLRVWDEAMDTTETLVEGGVYRLYLSPDGETVAFLRQEQPGMISGSKQMTLWAVDAGGGNERLLVGGDQFRAMGPARIGEFDVLAVNPLFLTWLPGTQELALRVYASINTLDKTTEPEVRLVDTATGAQRVLLVEGTGAFTFAPAGQRMTLADDNGIDLLDVGGGNRIADVVTYPTIGFEAGVWYPLPVWADDGRTFSISIPSANLFDGEETLTVWEVAAEDGAARELATFNGFPLPFSGNVGSAIFSPDQSKIAFYHTPERSNEGVLVVADVRGEWQAVYDAGWGPRFLGWAPDGSRFAYVLGQGQRGLLRIGRLCERPIVFDAPPPAGDTPVHWIDSERFLYQAPYGSAGPTTLLLGALDGSVREIGRLSDSLDSYTFDETG